MIDVSIIIVSWNTRDILADCLDSVYKTTSSIRFETIVIDNNSADNTCQMVRTSFPNVILIENQANRGFAAANNQGLDIAKGRYVFLLNSDTIVMQNAIEKLIDFADANPHAAVVGPKVLNKNGTLQPTCFMFPSITNMLLSATYLYKIFPKSRIFSRERMGWWNRDDQRQVDVVTGCAMLIRQQVIKQIGILDENYFMYCEETDFCYRCKKAGWQILFTPDPQIIHLGGASSIQISRPMAMQLRASILLFFAKHKSRLQYLSACLLTSLFCLLRIPYWLFHGIVLRNRHAMHRTITYLLAAFKALGGWQALSFKAQTK